MSRTSTTIIRRATTKPYILGIPTYPHLLPSLRGPLRPVWAGASLSYLILGISVHNVAMDLGAVEIFFIVVVVALVAYVVWRLVIRPRR